MKPRISVVVPSYNHERFIAQAVRSVLDQPVEGLELVVVDDGSSDGSPKIVHEVFSLYPDRRTVLVEQENAGAHAAIMRAIEESQAPVVAILNSDDYYAPNRLARVLPFVEDLHHAFAFTKITLVGEDGRPLLDDHAWPQWYRMALGALESQPTIGFALFQQNLSVTSGNFVFTRALYDALGGFSAHRFLHDWDFLIRTVYYCEPIFIPEELMSYRIHGDNATESVRVLLEDEGKDAVWRYRTLCAKEIPPNRLAPHPDHWPHYFPLFKDGTPTFFDDQPSGAHISFN